MKVCKFDKIEDEDKINRIIKYIINENPYVIAIPPLLPLEEKAREISIGWFREDNETVRSAIKSIEYYCYARVDRLTANVELQRNIKEIISTRIKNMYAWTENKADLLIDKTIRAEIYRLSADLLTHCLQAQGFRSKMFDSGTFVQIDKEKNFNIPLIRESVQQYTQQNRDIDIFVIPLSLCKNIYGEIDFLSEKQNDYYATVLAASFNAEEIILSSDFKNVHTDTHSSREQHSLTYDEAENLIGSGVHLLYADSITLAARSNMVMRLVEPTHFNNERLYISSHDSGKSIKAFLSQDSLTSVRFTSLHVLPGYLLLGKIFDIINKYQINVISMSSSNVSISMILSASRDTLRIIQRELYKYAETIIEEDMSVIHVIGSLHWEHPNIESEILSVLKDIPISQISYGGSDNCFTLSLPTYNKNKAIDSLSKHFFSKTFV